MSNHVILYLPCSFILRLRLQWRNFCRWAFPDTKLSFSIIVYFHSCGAFIRRHMHRRDPRLLRSEWWMQSRRQHCRLRPSSTGEACTKSFKAWTMAKLQDFFPSITRYSAWQQRWSFFLLVNATARAGDSAIAESHALTSARHFLGIFACNTEHRSCITAPLFKDRMAARTASYAQPVVPSWSAST